jgi:hypothetical protein
MDRGLSVADWIRNGEEVGELEVDLNRPNTEKGLVTIRRRMTRSTVILTRAKASLRLSSACAPLSRLTCGSVVFAACSSSQGASQFWIDDVPKKEKEVLAFVRGLDCQLDNLCHFLPQEMVKVFRDVAGRY